LIVFAAISKNTFGIFVLRLIPSRCFNCSHIAGIASVTTRDWLAATSFSSNQPSTPVATGKPTISPIASNSRPPRLDL
jgi:hypothetical protein